MLHKGHFGMPGCHMITYRMFLSYLIAGEYVFAVDASSPQILFTNNETNIQKMNTSSGLGEMPDLINVENHFKDAFHDFVIHGWLIPVICCS